jgi:hypothetical protein
MVSKHCKMIDKSNAPFSCKMQKIPYVTLSCM